MNSQNKTKKSANAPLRQPKAVNVKRIVTVAVSAVLLVGVLLGALLGLNAYRNSGKGIRDVVVLKSEHFTLTLPMYSYYFRSMDKGADKDLVAMALTEQLALYEAALADGMKLSEERHRALIEQLEALVGAAEKREQSIDEFLSLQYGRGVKLSDIADLLNMTALAAEKDEAMWNGISIADGDIKQYCKDNSEQFLFCDYLSHVFTVPLNGKMTTEEKEQMVALYESYAKRLAECADAEAFAEMVISYEESFAKDADPDALLTDADKDEIRASIVFERSSYAAYQQNSDSVLKELNSWLFDGDRKAGDSKVLPYTNLEKNSATVGVYYMTRPLYTNSDPTHTLYDITLSFDKYTKAAAEANAEKAKNAYLKNPTEATLATLAGQYGGGLSEYVAHTSELDADLYGWLAQVRKAGDTLVYEASDGWHMVCYMEEGIAECYAQAKNILKADAYEAVMETYRKAYAVTVNPASYTDLPALRYGWLIF